MHLVADLAQHFGRAGPHQVFIVDQQDDQPSNGRDVLSPLCGERRGGLARDRPYPGSTTVTTVNGGVTSLVRTLVIELAPIRVNAIHNGIVGDSPQWRDMPPERHKALVERTPIGRLVTMSESMTAARFLLENTGVNGINLVVDGGWICM